MTDSFIFCIIESLSILFNLNLKFWILKISWISIENTKVSGYLIIFLKIKTFFILSQFFLNVRRWCTVGARLRIKSWSLGCPRCRSKCSSHYSCQEDCAGQRRCRHQCCQVIVLIDIGRGCQIWPIRWALRVLQCASMGAYWAWCYRLLCYISTQRCW